MHKTTAGGIAGLLAVSLLGIASPPRASLESVLDALEQVRSFKDAAISPDGVRVAWVERIRSREGTENLSVIDVSDVAAPSARRVTGRQAARVSLRCREGPPTPALHRSRGRRAGAAPDGRHGPARPPQMVAR